MNFMLDCPIPELTPRIGYQDPILLTGSCFTEHIGNTLQDLKFKVLQNPNGILFDPASVGSSLISWMENRPFDASRLFYHNELWQSWHHHSMFSGLDQQQVLQRIDAAQTQAHEFLKTAKWLIITLGSSFSYRLTNTATQHSASAPSPTQPSAAMPNAAAAPIHSSIPGSDTPGTPVANCHRAPGAWFNKHMMAIEETNAVFDECLLRLFSFNPKIQVIFTVSPVRHIRDGVVENNRSKARLIEVVHHLAGKFNGVHYFPAYELVIDVLRDYRFYDIDMVHPNYSATGFVLEKFTENLVEPEARTLMEEIRRIVTARRHKPFQPATQAHQRFLSEQHAKTLELQRRYPFLDLKEELSYFSV